MNSYSLTYDEYVQALKEANVTLDPERLALFKPFIDGIGDKNPTVSEEERAYAKLVEGKVFPFTAVYLGRTRKCELRFNLTSEAIERFDNRISYMHTPWSWSFSVSAGDNGYSGTVWARTPEEAIELATARIKEESKRHYWTDSDYFKNR